MIGNVRVKLELQSLAQALTEAQQLTHRFPQVRQSLVDVIEGGSYVVVKRQSDDPATPGTSQLCITLSPSERLVNWLVTQRTL